MYLLLKYVLIISSVMLQEVEMLPFVEEAPPNLIDDLLSAPDGASKAQTYNSAVSNALNRMDRSVKPCDDFYRFACGKWLKDTVIPEDLVDVNSFSILTDKIQEQLKTTLEQPSPSSELRTFKLAKNLYKSCMNIPAIEEQGLKRVLGDLKKLGGWPVLEGNSWNEQGFEWTQATYKLRQLGYPFNFFFRLSVSPDMKNSKNRLLHLDGPVLRIGGHDYMQEYHSLMVNIAVLLGAKRDVAEEQLHDAAKLEIELSQIAEEPELGSSYNPMLITQLSEMYPSIPWKDYISHMLPPGTSVRDDHVVIVQAPGYIRQFVDLMKLTPKKTQANYIMWTAVESVINYLNHDARARHLEWLTVIEGRTGMGDRWKECMEIVSTQLPVSVGALYVRRNFNKESKRSAMELVDNIKKQFIEMLQSVDWMDPKTKANAMQKATSMHTNVGYPDELLDDRKLEEYHKGLEFDGNDFLDGILKIAIFDANRQFGGLNKPIDDTWAIHNAAEANAGYYVSINTISIPAGILQGIAFGSDRPKYMNYGAIGSVIGHEITHGFDHQGRKFDKEGSLVDWWEPATLQKYNAKAQCIIDQYGGYTAKEVGMKIDGKRTQGENIADNGGFKAAYRAYKDWSARNGQEQVPSGVQFTPNQMLWISTAQFWCTSYRPEILKSDISSGVHSPAEFRILGALSNIPEFSQDFKCPAGSTMNPQKKCTVW
ncbi:phosphate-regulating neutral endopeptidase [Fopius arisanus]|uniref:PHEX_1 protein n=1 Tax=Fopius arisanus TaxID=64838 RepID=A0A0C9R565_9HYME|nr:PREDICTED: phosphate-regulating neutral endopeptidase-like [Fopius arisanus]